MRALHYLSQFSRLSETFVYNQVRSLDSEAVRVVVAAHKRLNRDRRPFPNVITTGVPWWYQVGLRLQSAAFRALGSPRFRIADAAIQNRLRSAISQVDPHVIHAHFGPNGVRVCPLAEEFSRPLVVSFYGYDVGQAQTSSEYGASFSAMIGRIDAGVALSETMKEQLIKLGLPQEKAELVRLGVDLERLSFDLPGDELRTVVTVGRLVPKKGHKDLLRAIARVNRSEDARLRLRIVGDGPLRSELQELTRRRGWDWVEFCGALPHADALDVMRRADLVALCSKRSPDADTEGTPTVLLEAQAIGRPCLSTTHSGIPEIIPQDNHWLLAEEGDSDSIAATLRRALGVEPDRLRDVARRGRKFVETRHDIRRQAGKVCRLYRKLI